MFVLAALGLLCSCDDLPAIAERGCGNRLVEPATEDCDGQAPGDAYCARPDEANACRFLCTDAAKQAHPCPGGYACGVDGICRTPMGSFVQAGRAIEAEASSLAIGDFDDDKRADLLAVGTSDNIGRSPAQVVFFSDNAERAAVQRVPGLLGSPVVGRFTDSPYAGLAFASIPGLAMLIGRRDRQFFPRSYPFFSNPGGASDARVFAVDAIPTRSRGPGGAVFNDPYYEGDEPLLYASTSGVNVLFHSGNEDPLTQQKDMASAGMGGPGPAIRALLPHPPSQLAGDAVWGMLDQGSYCPLMLFGFRGESDLHVYRPCSRPADPANATWSDPVSSVTAVPLLPDVVINQQPLIARIDGDEFLDVVVGVGNSESSELSIALVAYGDGAGGLHVDKGGTGPVGFTLLTVPSEQVSNTPCGLPIGDPELAAAFPGQSLLLSPLAIGDVDGDAVVDFVTTLGLCTSRDLLNNGGDTHYQLVASSLGALWTEAHLLDVNVDGLLDVVYSRQDSRSLDFFLNSPSGYFNPATVSLNGSPGLLRTGDFDGDGAPDVAFRESGVQSTSNVGAASGDAVSVLFGGALQIPSEVARVGRFTQIDHLAVGQTFFPLFKDNLSDLGIVSRITSSDPAVPDILNISQILGASDRALRSPLLLNEDNGPGAWLPTLQVPGRFTSHDVSSQQDLMVLAARGDSDELALWRVALTGDAELRDFKRGASFLRASSQKDRFRELSLGAGDLDGDGFDEAICFLRAASGWQGLVERTRGDLTTVDLLPGFPLDFSVDRRSHPVTLDLDRDGKNDVLMTGFRGASGEGARVVVVLWGKGDGTFEPASSLLDLPSSQQAQEACAVRGVAGSEALVLSDQQLYRLTGAGRTLSVSEVEVADSDQRGGVALACGDIDGDGVDDVAVASGSLLRIFRGTAGRP